MGMMQPKVHGVEEVKNTIKSIEDNTQMSDNGTLKQSIVQDVQNSSKLSGEGCLGGGNHKHW